MAEKAWEKTKYTGIWKKRTARGTQIWIMYDAPRVWREGKPRRNQKQELVPSGKIRDAVALREQRRQEVKQGHHGEKSQAHFGELVEDYLINALPDISPRTRDQYRLYASHPLKALGDRKVSEITPEDIEGLHNDLLKQHAPAYVQQIMSRFKAIMARGVARDYVIRNPFDKVNIKTKRQRPKHSPMDQDETRHFLAHIRDRGTPHDIPWYVMFLMAIDCGLRLGELLAVKWEYVL